MRPQHGLRAAQVRIPGNHRVRIPRRDLDQRRSQSGDQAPLAVALGADPEPHVERDLLVAAAPGVDFVGQFAGALLELPDHQRVDVLVVSAVEDVRVPPDLLERLDDALALGGGENAHPFERARERLRAGDVGIEQPPVEMERTGEALENLRGSALETPAPEFQGVLLGFAGRHAVLAALTRMGSPIRLMKPSASFWSYAAPMVKLAISSEYSE